jgi:hypothetical protein
VIAKLGSIFSMINLEKDQMLSMSKTDVVVSMLPPPPSSLSSSCDEQGKVLYQVDLRTR